MGTHGESVRMQQEGVPFITTQIYGWDIYRVYRQGTDIISIVLKDSNGNEHSFVKEKL